MTQIVWKWFLRPYLIRLGGRRVSARCSQPTMYAAHSFWARSEVFELFKVFFQISLHLLQLRYS